MRIAKKIIGMIITVVVLVYVGVIVYDFIMFTNNEAMKFCIKENTYEYSYGTTYECVGVGYKAYRYDWPNSKDGHYRASNFGPFFISERKDQ